jgi:hypothetical protein
MLGSWLLAKVKPKNPQIRQQCYSDGGGVTHVAMAEAGAGTFFGGRGGHQSADRALIFAGFMLVHFGADEEFAEPSQRLVRLSPVERVGDDPCAPGG